MEVYRETKAPRKLAVRVSLTRQSFLIPIFQQVTRALVLATFIF